MDNKESYHLLKSKMKIHLKKNYKEIYNKFGDKYSDYLNYFNNE